jgi:outer membrane autotransporter protein
MGTQPSPSRFNAYTAGGYWTHFGPSGWYLDGLVQNDRYSDITANSERLPKPLTTDGHGFGGSLEGGYPIKFYSLTVEPQAQMIYQEISLDNSSDEASAVDFDKTNSTEGRLGVRIANTWSLGQVRSENPHELTAWATLSVWRDFQGDSTTSFPSETGPINFVSNLGGNWVQGNLGVTAQLTEVLSFYGTIGGDTSFNGSKAYNAIAGLRVNI